MNKVTLNQTKSSNFILSSDTTKRSFEKVISEVAEMDSELKVLEKKLCTLIAPVGEHNDEGQ